MTVVMQQTKQTMITRCHLRLERQWYAVVVNRIGFESDVFKKKQNLL